MKKIGMLLVFTLILLMSGCGEKTSTYTKDEIRFRQEYESFNGKIDDSLKEYQMLEIMEDNNIVYETPEQIIKRLEQGTGIIYFGSPSSPWCRRVVPVLLKTATSLGVSHIYYLDASSIRDEKELEYQRIIELLQESLTPYQGLEDESIKRLYFPTVVFVKDGELLGLHVGAVETVTDPYQDFTLEQEQELSKIYRGYMHQILGDVCDQTC